MSNHQSNDQGYKSVMKEYDFYNDDINDFEIIDEIPTNYINTSSNNNNSSKNNNSLKNSAIEKQKDKMNKFIINIFKIIFKSRNKLSEFASKSKLKNDENNKTDISFTFGIEELIAYDSFKDFDENDENKRQQYIIDFFLYENAEDDTGSLKSVRVKGSPKLLVERWKIKYRENFLSNKDNINNLEAKLKIIEKDVILYSHLLPLFNISKKNNYFLEFKFNPTSKDKKKFVDENMTKKIKIVKEEFFDFKLSITYLKITPHNISYLLKKYNNDFVIIPSKKSRRRFLSDEYYKKSSNQLLKKESKQNINDINNNNNQIKNALIIENYFNDDDDSGVEKNIVQKRRLSLKEKKVKSKYFNQQDSLDSNSDDFNSDDNLSLVISETNNENIKNSNDNLNIDKIIDNRKRINKKDSFVRKCSTFRGKSKNQLQEEDNIKNLDLKNSKISKIVKEYKYMKKMMITMPNFGNINYDKLSNFISQNY